MNSKRSFFGVYVVAVLLFVAALGSVHAGEIRGSSGNNFSFGPTATPGVFLMTHPGVARLTGLGNCQFDGTELLTPPTSTDARFLMKGTWRFVSADGSSTLEAEVEGVGTPDPANAAFVTLEYTITFTGGTGLMAGAHGKGKMEGVAMVTGPTGGTTTFVFSGQISTHGQGSN